MPALEKTIQKRFFNLIRGKDNDGSFPIHQGMQTYAELVEYRFFDVLSNAFPILFSKVDEESWNHAVISFLKSKPKSPYIWEAAGEFRTFILKKKLFDFPWLKDLLWFEWVELQSIMAVEEGFGKTDAFDWSQKWRLAESTFMRKLHYPVFKDSFEQKTKTPLILYCHQDEHEVYYLEITEFLFHFLTMIHTGEKPESALKHICNKFNLEQDEVRKLLHDPLTGFVNNGILVKQRT